VNQTHHFNWRTKPRRRGSAPSGAWSVGTITI
jgi:hypothetical protein